MWGLIESGPVVQEKKIFTFRQCFFFLQNLNLEIDTGLSFVWTWLTPFTQGCLFFICIIGISLVVLVETIFNVVNLLFSLRVWPFILINLNPLHPRMLFSKPVWLKLTRWFWNSFVNVVYCLLDHRGDSVVERSPRMREIKVRSPVATDPNR